MMTLDEARAELGVGAADDSDTVRRAYLKLLKTRKPDADPAGFQRLREAYEVARARGGELFVAPADVAPPAPRPEVSDEPNSDDELVAAPARTEEPWLALAKGFRAAARSAKPAPSASAAIEQILLLLERQDGKSARRLSRALGEWVAAVGEIQAVPGNLGITWRVARDLARLDEYAPPRLVGAFAEAERTGDMRNAIAEATAFRSERRVNAEQIEEYMRRSLFGVEYLATLLREPPAWHAPVVVRRPFKALIWLTGALVLLVARVLFHDPPPPRKLDGTPAFSEVTPARQWSEAQRPRAKEATARLTTLRRSLGARQGVLRVLDGFTPDGCASPANEDEALRVLREQVLGDPAALELIDKLIADWSKLCGAPAGRK